MSEAAKEDENRSEERLVFRTKNGAFYGRQDELLFLERMYNKIAYGANQNRAELVLIRGYSGSGKSALVSKFIEHIRETHEVFSVSGKFQELQSSDPFSAIVDAFAEFFNELAVGEPQTVDDVREAITETLGDEGRHILASMIPGLKDIVEAQQEDMGRWKVDCGTKDTDLRRFTYAFGKFLQALSVGHRPLMFFLDDLHFADAASIELLRTLTADKSLKNVLLVGAYRSNAISDEHPLLKLLRIGERERKDQNVCLLELDDLPLDTINDIVADALRMDPEKTRPLAEIVFGKTDGNIFYTLQLLDQMQRKGLLFFSEASLSWEWDRDQIEKEATVSDNVIDLVGSKLRSLPADLQEALSIASFTRSTFDLDTLKALMEYEGYDVDNLESTLNSCVSEGLLEKNSSNDGSIKSYNFVHDRIQEVSRTLLIGDKLNAMRVRMGKQLIARSESTYGEPWMLFVGVDHLNASVDFASTDNVTPVELARLNLSVAEKAIRLAAYVPASNYLRKGRDALARTERAEIFSKNYELALKLYRESADVEMSCGNFEEGYLLSRAVFFNSKCHLDKLPTYISLARGLERQERFTESCQVCQEALQILGVYPRRCLVFQTILDYLTVTRIFAKLSDFDILLLPKLTDEQKLITLKLWHQVARVSYISGRKMLLATSVLRMLRMTLQWGISGLGASALSAWALVRMKDAAAGRRVASLAQKVIGLCDDKQTEAAVLLVTVCSQFVSFAGILCTSN